MARPYHVVLTPQIDTFLDVGQRNVRATKTLLSDFEPVLMKSL
jgi:hypothetical protein